ncbi:MAG: metalloregulator ArsR/SmtB family transcription factor [Clostridia bacterium]
MQDKNQNNNQNNNNNNNNNNNQYQTHENNAKVFKALCDSKRLAILQLLQGGEKCACNLIEELEIAQSALSYHMKILCDSGIVQSRSVGKWTHYIISKKGSETAIELLTSLTAIAETEETSCK